MLLKNKPRAMAKLRHYMRETRRSGWQSALRGFQLNPSNRCNFRCRHCFTRSDSPGPGAGAARMDRGDIRRLADEADALGMWEVDIQGGEPLMLPDLEELVRAIRPERFYVFVTTNGWLLDARFAGRLAAWGLDRVTVSIDSFDAGEHDSFRGKPGAFDRAIAALAHVKAAGLTANINVTAGHYNARSADLCRLLEFAGEKGYMVSINPATPSGAWSGNHGILLDPQDVAHLESLRRRHKGVFRDLWSFYDDAVLGCPAVNVCYVTPRGDVLPCPYIHVKLGNLRTESLEGILRKGFGIRYFGSVQRRCLAGENKEFVRRFMSPTMSVLRPWPLETVFTGDDRVEPGGIDIVGNSRC